MTPVLQRSRFQTIILIIAEMIVYFLCVAFENCRDRISMTFVRTIVVPVKVLLFVVFVYEPLVESEVRPGVKE